eukprot:5136427-Amphidinium_carterae.1
MDQAKPKKSHHHRRSLTGPPASVQSTEKCCHFGALKGVSFEACVVRDKPHQKATFIMKDRCLQFESDSLVTKPGAPDGLERQPGSLEEVAHRPPQK